MAKPTIKQWRKAGCVFCAMNPSVEEKSAYWLEDNVRIKGLGTGLVVGGICKRHFDAIGKKYLSTLKLRKGKGFKR